MAPKPQNKGKARAEDAKSASAPKPKARASANTQKTSGSPAAKPRNLRILLLQPPRKKDQEALITGRGKKLL